ncbi:hypothetical protein OIU76_018297, partial [Salix suchowensis]
MAASCFFWRPAGHLLFLHLSIEESPSFSNLGLDLSSCVACDETCCSECSSWLCFSTYSGNNFLNAA